MDAALKQDLATAIEQQVSAMGTADFALEYVWRYSRRVNGNFSGQREQTVCPSFDWTFRAGVDAALQERLSAAYPDLMNRLSGSASLGTRRMEADMLLRGALVDAARASRRGVGATDAARFAVDELARVLEVSEVRVAFVAPVANLTMPPETFIDFGPAGTLRQLTDEEVNGIYGGTHNDGFSHADRFRMSGCAFVGEWTEPRVTGPMNSDLSQLTALFEALQAAVRILRAFRPISVGVQLVRLHSADLPAMGIQFRTFEHEFVRPATYQLDAADAESLGAFVGLFGQRLSPALDIATTRLAFAANRTDARDRLIDAVIGLEALLLPGMEAELKFRFSLYFAALHADADERRRAYAEMRDLYNLRSKLSHGAPVTGPVLVGSQQMSLSEAADNATEKLRGLCERCLKMATPSYTDNAFWVELVLGLHT